MLSSLYSPHCNFYKNFKGLPVEEEIGRNSGSGNESGGGSPLHQEVLGGGDSGHPPSTTASETCGMLMYSCHLLSDVIWAPTS
ncbi:hypothetical protein BC332_18499 [Capsicum chinense]|nr:hypothetical protein BC332_18499 [Capsicum chinense]